MEQGALLPVKAVPAEWALPRFPCAAARGFAGFLNDANEGSTVAKLTQIEFVF